MLSRQTGNAGEFKKIELSSSVKGYVPLRQGTNFKSSLEFQQVLFHAVKNFCDGAGMEVFLSILYHPHQFFIRTTQASANTAVCVPELEKKTNM